MTSRERVCFIWGVYAGAVALVVCTIVIAALR